MYLQLNMPEHQDRVEKMSEAETLMNEADRIIWDKKFEEAINLCDKVKKIFEGDEFQPPFCENRICSIQERISQQKREKTYVWLSIISFCVAIASIILIEKYSRI